MAVNNLQNTPYPPIIPKKRTKITQIDEKNENIRPMECV